MRDLISVSRTDAVSDAQPERKTSNTMESARALMLCTRRDDIIFSAMIAVYHCNGTVIVVCSSIRYGKLDLHSCE